MQKLRIYVAMAMMVVMAVALTPAHAAGASVEMLNKLGSERFVYSPSIVQVEPGDAVQFLATDKGHNAVSIDGMFPEGAEPVKVPFNRDAEITFVEQGVYAIKCTPHVGLGMVTLIVVGEPQNLETVRSAAGKLPPKARDRVLEMLSKV